MLNILPHSLHSLDDTEENIDSDHIVIRGIRIDLKNIVNPEFLMPEKKAEIAESFQNAKPFSHFVIDNLFNPILLELINEEFDAIDKNKWRTIESAHEKTHRLPQLTPFASATQLYFDTINSGWFVNFLSELTGVKNLITDPLCHNGGMHEIRQGGFFDIHLDFNLHHQTLLRNEMILITYLNKSWRHEYGGILELWDTSTHNCAVEVLPEFGRTVLFRHGLHSFHGHPKPVNCPEGFFRRSLANYYYTNSNGEKKRPQQHWTLFFPNAVTGPWFKLVYNLKYRIIPSIGGGKLLRYLRLAKNRFQL